MWRSFSHLTGNNWVKFDIEACERPPMIFLKTEGFLTCPLLIGLSLEKKKSLFLESPCLWSLLRWPSVPQLKLLAFIIKVFGKHLSYPSIIMNMSSNMDCSLNPSPMGADLVFRSLATLLHCESPLLTSKHLSNTYLH